MALNLIIKESTQSHLIGMLNDEECSIILNIVWKAKERAERKINKNLKSPSYDWTGNI